MINKRHKKILITMVLALSIFTVACGSSSDSQPVKSNENAQEVKGLEEAFAEYPIMLTSIGQSADVEMIKALMGSAQIEHEVNKMVTANDLGDVKTLILAVGGSSKGLGAAGIDADEEIERTKDLVNAAKENGVKVIAMHVGGETNRGELSDKFIRPACEQADYIIVVESGNNDGLFTTIASEGAIPMDSVAGITDAIEPLKGAFK